MFTGTAHLGTRCAHSIFITLVDVRMLFDVVTLSPPEGDQNQSGLKW